MAEEGKATTDLFDPIPSSDGWLFGLEDGCIDEMAGRRKPGGTTESRCLGYLRNSTNQQCA